MIILNTCWFVCCGRERTNQAYIHILYKDGSVQVCRRLKMYYFNLKWMVYKEENLVGGEMRESLLAEKRHDEKIRRGVEEVG